MYIVAVIDSNVFAKSLVTTIIFVANIKNGRSFWLNGKDTIGL